MGSVINEYIKSISPGQDIFSLPDDLYAKYVKEYRKARVKPKEKGQSRVRRKKSVDISPIENDQNPSPDKGCVKLSPEEKKKIKHEAMLLERAKKLVKERYEQRQYIYAHRQDTGEPKQYKSYRLRANAKRIKFELTIPEFTAITEMDCSYCGGQGGGIDRVDSGIGYTKENSTPCCWKCNAMKYTHTVDNFINHIKKIYNHISEKDYL